MPAPRSLIAAGLIATGAALFAFQSLALADDAPAKPSRVPPAEVVGEPVSCINIAQIRGSQVRDNAEWFFKLSRRSEGEEATDEFEEVLSEEESEEEGSEEEESDEEA